MREVNGVVRDGVVEFLGTPLPNGTFVKVRSGEAVTGLYTGVAS